MLVQQNTDTCYSTNTDHLLSGSHAQRPDLDDLFEFGLQGGPGDHRVGRFDDELRRKTRRKQKRQVIGGDGCGGALPLGDLNVNIAARLRLQVLGDDFTYRALEPTVSATRGQDTTRPHSTTEPKTTQTRERHTTVTEYSTARRTCDGSIYPQPCYHYSSVIVRNPLRRYSMVTCKNLEKSNSQRPLPDR